MFVVSLRSGFPANWLNFAQELAARRYSNPANPSARNPFACNSPLIARIQCAEGGINRVYGKKLGLSTITDMIPVKRRHSERPVSAVLLPNGSRIHVPKGR